MTLDETARLLVLELDTIKDLQSEDWIDTEKNRAYRMNYCVAVTLENNQISINLGLHLSSSDREKLLVDLATWLKELRVTKLNNSYSVASHYRDLILEKR